MLVLALCVLKYYESAICAVREESLLYEIQPDEFHIKMQDPNFLEEAQLIDVREPEEVYAYIFFCCLLCLLNS